MKVLQDSNTIREERSNMSNFIRGVDISSYPEMLDKGFQYFDYDGNKVDLLEFAKEQGINYGRLRLWNNPARVPQAEGYCDLEHTKWMAKELVSRGMKFMLDFHYSDWWADPGHQEMPEAWKDLPDDELVQAVYSFTREALEALDENGTYPDSIQIGNEIRCGMMWPAGKVSNWPMLARLINAGIRAVRDTQKERDTQVVIHLDQGGRYHYLEEWFDAALEHGVTDFDIIGLSYYPFWHGTFNDIKNSMERLVGRYHKPIVLAEIAHAFRRSSGSLFGEQQELNAGFPANPVAQRKVLELIMSITAHVKNGMGLGVFYWEPFSRSKSDDGSWGSCMGVVDANGIPTEGCKAFAFDVERVDCAADAKIYAPGELTVSPSADLQQCLPKHVNVLKWDGSIEKQTVIWANVPGQGGLPEQGELVLRGTVDSSEEPVSLRVRIETQDINYVRNGNFAEDTDYWRVTANREVRTDIRPEIAEEYPYGTENYFYFECKDNFEMELSQTIVGLEPGKYILSVEYRGDNTTGVQVALYAKGQAVNEKTEIFPTDREWRRSELPLEVSDAGEMEVGIKVDSPAIYGKVRKVTLKKK